MQVSRFWRTKEQRYRLLGVKDENGIRLDKKTVAQQDNNETNLQAVMMPVLNRQK